MEGTVRMPIFADMAPRAARVVATALAARNGMNMGFLVFLVVGPSKCALNRKVRGRDRGRCRDTLKHEPLIYVIQPRLSR